MGLISPLLSDGTPAPLNWPLSGQARARVQLRNIDTGPGLHVVLWPVRAFDSQVTAVIAGNKTVDDTMDLEKFDYILAPTRKSERRVGYSIHSVAQKMEFDLVFYFAGTQKKPTTYRFEIEAAEGLMDVIPVILQGD